MRIAVTLGLVVLPVCVLAQIIPPPLSNAWLVTPEQVTVFCDPVGDGQPLTQARAIGTPNGQWEDATIIVQLLDGGGDPVAGYPAEDLWLSTSSAGLILCDGGLRADAPTAVNGQTTFSGTLRMGGSFHAGGSDWLQVATVSGPVSGTNLGNLSLVSPDLDGDLDVDLTDVILFAQSYMAYPVYDRTIDFYYDGMVNLSDLVLMAQHRNLVCRD